MDKNKQRGREIDFTKPPFGQPNEKETIAKICELAEKWNEVTKKWERHSLSQHQNNKDYE